MPERTQARVVIVGGGVAALEAALALDALAGWLVGMEIVTREPRFYYRPLAVAKPFQLGELKQYDVGQLAARAGAVVTIGSVTRVDADAHAAHTAAGATLHYDMLLVACGTVTVAAVEGALTFRGPGDMEAMSELLREAESGSISRIAFTIPDGAVWSLPAFELALLTVAALEARGRHGVEVVITTPEETPLGLFGPDAARATAALLERRGIAVHTGAKARSFRDGKLLLATGEHVCVDRVVALPRLEGPRIDGLPQTRAGFIPVDAHGRVEGVPDVYAAGDVTTFPVKQGGIASQQADVAAQAIAQAAGADVVPQPFRPVLRGMLLTGAEPQFMRHDLAHPESTPVVSLDELWWPPAKIAGHYLGPLILSLDDAGQPVAAAELPGVPIQVELAPATWEPVRTGVGVSGDGDLVGDVPAPAPLIVAPTDTLGEIAEQMCERHVDAALVVDSGRLIGIVTARDMLVAFAQRVHPSDARARQWMTAHPVAVHQTAGVVGALVLMQDHGVHHLPVVNDDGSPVAVLRSCDGATFASELAEPAADNR